MQWPRRTCPFGLADEAEHTENIILAAIGYSLREATTDVTLAPLPESLAALLRQLETRESAICAEAQMARQRSIRRTRVPAGGCAALMVPEPTVSAGSAPAPV
jgi:hypothetical protein